MVDQLVPCFGVTFERRRYYLSSNSRLETFSKRQGAYFQQRMPFHFFEQTKRTIADGRIFYWEFR